MNTTKKRLWIDMTDLRVWSGHMTGVQRVVYQNAKRFMASSEYETHCFMFDESREVFIETPFADIEMAVEAALAERPMGDEATGSRSLKARLKNAPRALIRRMPASLKRRIPSVAKRALRRGARVGLALARKSRNRLRRMVHQPGVQLSAVQFKPDDTVLIMGKSWDFPALIPALGRLKQARHFRLVHLIHDMIPILEPHLFGPGLFEPYTRCMFEVCSLSDVIATVSESTKRDVVRFCERLAIPVPPIQAVRLGDDLLDIELDPNMPAPNPRIKKGEFILQVGTIELRKNHLLTYLAYREAALRGIELPMWVIMGSQGWLVGDVLYQIEHDPLVKNKVVILRGRPDSDRLWLYKNCRFTVFPSTYEGWGMPVGESLAYGKVCITSTTASLPEVGGKYADAVSPYNSQAMLKMILRYLDDKTLRVREKEINAGYKPTSWDTTYVQLSKLLG